MTIKRLYKSILSLQGDILTVPTGFLLIKNFKGECIDSDVFCQEKTISKARAQKIIDFCGKGLVIKYIKGIPVIVEIFIDGVLDKIRD